MPKFILPNAEKGVVVINERYRFVDGVMPVSAADAPLIAKILCDYHGCELVQDEKTETADVVAADSALTAENTKTAETKPAAVAAKK